MLQKELKKGVGRESGTGVLAIPSLGNCKISGVLRKSQTGVSGRPGEEVRDCAGVCLRVVGGGGE